MADFANRHWLLSPQLDVATLENVLSLSLDVMEGFADARAILADLVEEGGNPRAAELARSEDDDDATRLAVVLGALPSRAVLVLGADFLEHILTREDDVYLGRQPYLFALKRLRSWCHRDSDVFPTSQVILFETSTQADVRHGGAWRSSRNTRWDFGKALIKLADGIRVVVAEYGRAPAGDEAWFDQIGLADVHVVEAAELARTQLAPQASRDKFNRETELAWQVSHLAEFLAVTRDAVTGS